MQTACIVMSNSPSSGRALVEKFDKQESCSSLFSTTTARTEIECVSEHSFSERPRLVHFALDEFDDVKEEVFEYPPVEDEYKADTYWSQEEVDERRKKRNEMTTQACEERMHFISFVEELFDVPVRKRISNAESVEFGLVLWESVSIAFHVVNAAEKFTPLDQVNHHVDEFLVLEACNEIGDERMEHFTHNVSLLNYCFDLALFHKVKLGLRCDIREGPRADRKMRSQNLPVLLARTMSLSFSSTESRSISSFSHRHWKAALLPVTSLDVQQQQQL